MLYWLVHYYKQMEEELKCLKFLTVLSVPLQFLYIELEILKKKGLVFQKQV